MNTPATEMLRAAVGSGRPLVLAHRGGKRLFAENSLEAFSRCKDAGADGVELDVRLCGSGELVVFHDDELHERTDGAGRVDETPWSALQKLRLRNYSGELTDERIPLLAEVLEALPPELFLNVEIKPARRDVLRLVRATVAVLGDDHYENTRPVELSSFSPQVMFACRALARQWPLGVLMERERAQVLWRAPLAWALSPSAVHPPAGFVTEELMHAARRRDLPVVTWTVNDPEKMKPLIEKGVAALITDRPDTGRCVVDELRPAKGA